MIKLSKSCLSNKEKNAVLRVLNKEFLGMGPEVKKFENDLTRFFGRKTLCVSSGTSALQLALQACGIKRNDQVLVPSLTYIATYQAINALGAIPVSVDVNKNTALIDIDDCKMKITDKTKAIIPVHYAGNPCDMGELLIIKNKYNIKIIEDAAHAFGSYYKGKKIGSFGDISCFSFDGIKNITSGEGGCVVSSDISIMDHIADARLLGVINDSLKRYKKKRSWNFDVKFSGWRYHMSDIMAAIGRAQLKRFRFLSEKRKKLASHYAQFLSKNPFIKLVVKDNNDIVPHIFPIILSKEFNVNKIRSHLFRLGIETGQHYKPNHQLTLFKSKTNLNLKNTEEIANSILSLPLHPDLKFRDIEYISKKLLDILFNSK